MITAMPRMSLPARPLRMDDLLPGAPARLDITEEMHARFFVDIPPDHRRQIEWRHGCIVGKPGCGKSETFRARAEIAVNKYGEDNVNLIYVDDLRTAIGMIDDKPVQYCIVDDASKCLSSRQVFEQAEVLGVFNRLRHHFRDYIKAPSGVFLCEFGWQRWNDLDPGFRDGTSLIFKTNMSSETERRSVRDFIGDRYMGVLDDIWDSMDRGVQTVKGYSVGRIGPKPINRGGVGIYRLPMTRWKGFPKIITSEEWEERRAELNRSEEERIRDERLEALRGDPAWAVAVECYDRHEAGESQDSIAESMGFSRKTVGRRIASVREAVSAD